MNRADVARPRGILGLAASAFVVLAAEPSFVLIDNAVVGHLGGVPLGGLGIGAAVMDLLLIIGTFVEYGTTARAARHFGAGRRPDAVHEGVQASWLGFAIGLVIVGLAQLLAHPMTSALAGGNAAVQHAAESWLRVAVCGMPGILLILAGNGWLRGVQDTRTPVRIVVVANVLSAALSPLLVYAAGIGLVGSALANVAGQAAGGVLFVVALRSQADRRRPSWTVMRAQLLVGRDLIVRSAAFQVAFLTAAGVASRMGTAQIGAHQIGLQLWNFTALLLDSFAIAAQSLVGAALGGSDPRSARAVAWQVARYGLWAGLAFGVLLALGWALIPVAFTSSAAVQHQAHVYWPWFAAMQPMAGVVFALDGVLIGAGDVGFLRTITVIGAVGAFAPLNVLALTLHWGIGGVWAGLAAFVAVRLVGMVARVRGGRWLVTGAA